MRQETIKAPKSARIVDIVLGGICLALAGSVLAWPHFALSLLLAFISIALLFAGLEGLILGSAGRGMSGGQRALRVVAGIIAIGLSIAVIMFPVSTAVSAVILLSIAFFVLGAAGIAKGLTERFMSGWARAMYIGAGAVAVCLSIPIMIYPAVGIATLYSLMAIILLVDGIAFVVAGVTGVVYVPIGVRAASRDKTWEAGAA